VIVAISAQCSFSIAALPSYSINGSFVELNIVMSS